MRFVAIILSVVLAGCATDRIRPWSPAEVSDIRAMVPTPVRLTPFPSFELSKPILGPVPDIRPHIQDALKEKAGIIVRRAGADGTIPPPSTLTCDVIYNSTGFALSAVSSGINSANDGDVICLERGSVWTASSGLNITTSHPDTNRVTICASTGTTCSDSGAANPKIVTTHNGNALQISVGGYEFRHIDWQGPGVGDFTSWYSPAQGSRDVRFHGGVVSHYRRFVYTLGANPPTNLEFGVCGAPLGVRDNYKGATGGNLGLFYGSWTFTAFRLAVSNLTLPIPMDHLIDLVDNSAPGCSGNCLGWDHPTTSNDIIVECGTYTSISTGGGLLNFTAGNTITIRDNVFDGFCAPLITFGGHGPDNNRYGWDIGDIYRNQFRATCPSAFAIAVATGSNIDIYSNIYRLVMGNNSRGITQMSCFSGAANSGDNDVQNVRIFNNTVYQSGDSEQPGFGSALVQTNPPACVSGVASPTNITVVNNLMMLEDSVDARALDFGGGTNCNSYGTNGSQVHHNYLVSLNDGTPQYFQSCAGSDLFVKSGTSPAATGDGWTALPGLTGDGGSFNNLPADFVPSSNTGRICGQGDSTFTALAGSEVFGVTRTTDDIGAIPCPP